MITRLNCSIYIFTKTKLLKLILLDIDIDQQEAFKTICLYDCFFFLNFQFT